MKIDIPDDLAEEAFVLLASPLHQSLTPWVRSLVRHEVKVEKQALRDIAASLERVGNQPLEGQEADK